MEFQLGAAVKTKIEKTLHDGVAGEITLPAGTMGIVCEGKTIRGTNWYLIELADERFPDPLFGVFDYRENELDPDFD